MTMNYNKRIFGCRVIECINSNLNDGFDDLPRMLPDGTHFCSDVSIKYLDRCYFERVLGKKLFMKKRTEIIKDNNKLKTLTLEDTLKGILPKQNHGELLNYLYKKEDNSSEGCIDARLFGFVSSVTNVNLGMTGALQYTQGINKLAADTNIVNASILAPFSTKKKVKETNKETGESETKIEDGKSATNGTYHILDHAAYAIDFTLDPTVIAATQETLNSIGGLYVLDEEDVALFKEATTKSATLYRTRRKCNNFDVFSLFITMKEGSKKVLNKNVSDFIYIESDSDKNLTITLNNNELSNILLMEDCESVEIYYSPFIKLKTNNISSPKLIFKEIE